MPSNECLRVLGYTVALAIHICNIIYMSRTTLNLSNNQTTEVFKSMENRYFTTWTFMLQVGYAALGLVCDLVVMKNSKSKDFRLPKMLVNFRSIMFDGVVWPSSWIVFSFFWSLYHYDRSLIFPDYLDNVITPLSNHIIHTFIVIFVMCEVLLRPRCEPSAHFRNIMQLTLHLCVYMCVLFYTYFERGLWLYPIFRELYGTVYFVMIFVAIGLLGLVFYYIQWPITRLIHGVVQETERKKQ